VDHQHLERRRRGSLEWLTFETDRSANRFVTAIPLAFEAYGLTDDCRELPAMTEMAQS